MRKMTNFGSDFLLNLRDKLTFLGEYLNFGYVLTILASKL